MQNQLTDDTFWPRASAWLAGDCADKTVGKLAVVGAPLRLGSITPGRCDLAPEAVRGILRKFSCYDVETDADLQMLMARDLGDLPLADVKLEDALEPLRDGVRRAFDEAAAAVVVLGGDNGVTRGGVHGLPAALEKCGLLTFDAHFDLRDLGAGLTNGNPVRALLADGLPGAHIVQIGIQPFANSRAYAEVARGAGLTVIAMDQVRERGIAAVTQEALALLTSQVEMLYVDFDIDVLDRAFAPATPGSRPGGLAPWELRRAAWLCGSHPLVRAIDLVEVDPTQDVAGATVMAAGACLLSFASGLLHRLQGRLPKP